MGSGFSIPDFVKELPPSASDVIASIEMEDIVV